MDGLPLALDQAGAYIEETSCSLGDYLELFQTRQVQLLRRRGEVASDHPASVVATWSLSFEKVEQANPLASDLLRLCAFLHPDAIPEEILHARDHIPRQATGSRSRRPLPVARSDEDVSTYSLLRCQGGSEPARCIDWYRRFSEDGMDEAQAQQWMERAVHVVHAVLPEVEPHDLGAI